ncbi:MAG: homocitrate synthase, partial [Pseudomonadota bacterium]
PKEVGSKRFYPIGKHSGSKTLKYHLNNKGIKPALEVLQELLPGVRSCVTSSKKCLTEQKLTDLYNQLLNSKII